MTYAQSSVPDAQEKSRISALRGRIQKFDSLTQQTETGDTPDSKTSKSSHRPTNSLFRQIRPLQSAATPPRRPLFGDTSIHRPHDSVSSTVSQSGNSPLRRGSLVKEAMRKLFGKKTRGVSSDEGGDSPNLHPYDFGPETPPDSNRLIDRLDTINVTPKQLRPQPLSPASPIGSPTSIRSGRKLNNVASASDELPLSEAAGPARRRVTLPSLYLSDPEARDLAKSLLVKSPAVHEEEEEGKEEARRSFEGMNLNDRMKSSIQAKRRSRSADALRDLMLRDESMSPTQWRTTDEVKLWRKRLLGTEADGLAEVTRESNSSDSIFAGRGADPSLEVAPDELLGNKSSLERMLSSQPSNPLVESLLSSMHDPDVSLERRVVTLEVKSMDLELAISKLQAGGRPVARSSAFSTDRRPSQAGSGDGRRPSLPSIPPVPQALGTRERVYSAAANSLPATRHMSTSTVRAEPLYSSSPPQPPPLPSGAPLDGISIDQYSALVTLIRREQTARKALEVQIRELREELRDLKRSRGVPDSGTDSSYPTPSSATRKIFQTGSVKRTALYEDDRPFTESETDTDSDFYSSHINAYQRSNNALSQHSSINGMI